MFGTTLKYHFSKKFNLKKRIYGFFQISNFFCFSLRQGTLVIGITELMISVVSSFLLLLCVTHAQDIVSLIKSELAQMEESDWTEKGLHKSIVSFFHDEKRLLVGERLALVAMFTIWMMLLISSINIVTNALLIYGTIRNSPYFLLPWTTTGLLGLIMGALITALTFFMPFKECKFVLLILLVLFYTVEWYAWTAVVNFYKELKIQNSKVMKEILIAPAI